MKEIEEDMQTFVSTKAEATEGLRGRVGELKNLYSSGIKTLDDLAGELDGNSQATFEHLNSEVSKHSLSLQDLLKTIASEADVILNELQGSLNGQGERLAAYAQQQREGHSRAVETTRSISKITVNFFKTLDMHASKLSQMVEEAQTVNDQKLCELEKKYEECAANEEKQLLAKVSELPASSNVRKKKLVQSAVDGLRESATIRTSKLQEETSTMQDFTCSVKDEWTTYIEKTETHYHEDIDAVESGKNELEEGLQHCMSKTKVGAEQWRNAQESLLNLETSNVASVQSIVKGGVEASQMLLTRLSSAASDSLGDLDVANNGLLSSIDGAVFNLLCQDNDHMLMNKIQNYFRHEVVEVSNWNSDEDFGKALGLL